jgi:hypothetical protein
MTQLVPETPPAQPQIVLTNTREIADPGARSVAIDQHGRTTLQDQLRAAIFTGDRVERYFQLRKVMHDAIQREASAVWPDRAARGMLEVGVSDITHSDHKVVVQFYLAGMGGIPRGTFKSFEVEIKYDDKGAVTGEAAFRKSYGRTAFLQDGLDNFVRNMNRTLGAPPRPATPTAENPAVR